MAVWGFVRLFWKPIALIAAGLAVLWYFRHYGDVRAASERQQIVSEMQYQLDAYKAQANKQINQGYRQHEYDLAQLALARSEPHPSVVCRSTSPQVRAASRISEPEAARDRPLPPRADESAHAPEFDPTAALYALADEADDRNAACRMLNQSVNGMPSAP